MKFLAVGLLVLLAGWMTLMASTGGIDLGLPVISGAPQATLKFTLVDAQELKDWLDQGGVFVLIDAEHGFRPARAACPGRILLRGIFREWLQSLRARHRAGT
jgi:hypothetical protein